MADIGVDTSSYPKPQGGKSILETMSQFGALQRQQQDIARADIAISKDRLDLTNQHYDYLLRELNSLGPTPTAEQLIGVGKQAVTQGLVPPDMFSNFVKNIPTDPSQVPAFRDRIAKTLLGTKEQINQVYGVPGTVQTQTGTSPVTIRQMPSPGAPQGITQTGPQIPAGIPPTQPVIDPVTGQPRLQGQQPPGPPIVPYNGRLPVGAPTSPGANVPGSTAPIGTKAIPTISYTQPVPSKDESRLPIGAPTGPVTGLPPGEGEVNVASGQQLARDLDRSANYQRDVFPLMQAIPALEKLGPKGTGPGTETINHLKSFVLSNVPGVKASDFNGTVGDYDKAKKYLTDFVNQTGSSGTNDKLAAAFAGNPSVNISNAAAVDVAKSALALRRMQQAQVMEFQRQGLPGGQYSRWVAKETNNLDPRAFGTDMMSADAKKKLAEHLQKSPSEAAAFEKSADIAKRLGYLNPSR